MTELEFAYLTGGFAGLFIGVVITIVLCRYRNKAALASLKRFEEMERSALHRKLKLLGMTDRRELEDENED